MANPLDQVTQDQRDDENRPLRRVMVYRDPIEVPEPQPVAENRLARAVAPEPEQTYDVMALIKQVRDYLANTGTGILGQVGVAGVRPGPEREELIRGRDVILGTGGQERYQFWPERMVRSGTTLPGEVSQGLVPVVDPETGRTSVPMIERAQDVAGLAGGGALTAKPGGATLGSGPMRPGGKMPRPKILSLAEWESLTPAERAADRARWNAEHAKLETPRGVKKVETVLEDATLSDEAKADWIVQNHNNAREIRDKYDELFKDALMEVHASKIKSVFKVGTPEEANNLLNTFKEKLGKTLMSDTQKPGAAISGAASSPAPVFYSALEHAVTNAAQETMSPQQWVGWLKNQPGLKAEEIGWTGLGDWLGQQKGKVSKKDVQAYLDEHKVEIKDVTKDGRLLDLDTAYDQALDEVSRKYGHLDQNGDEFLSRVDQRAAELSGGGEGGTKYSSYQLPGGENYREHLLTLPRKDPIHDPKYVDAKHRQRNGLDYDKDLVERVENMRAPEQGDYRSSHWDEPNVLAHVRTNERDVGGTPTLHIEEIQSDWHQAGRKQGYKDPIPAKERPAAIDKMHAIEKQMDDMVKQGKHITGEYGKDLKFVPEYEQLQADRNNLRKRIKGEGVPDAPFKTSWPELALKRMIRMAADEGKTRISWTPGEAQAARYDLGQHYKSIRVNKVEGRDGKYDVSGVPTRGGRTNIGLGMTQQKLADTVGKDLADKIVAQTEKTKDYSGLDLKIGGEGMKGFYDNMLPKMVEKLGKAHGVKVKKERLGIGGKGNPLRQNPDGSITGGHEVYYFDIPPAWRDQAVGKGFPLYMQGIPFPLTPVDHDPFAKKENK